MHYMNLGSTGVKASAIILGCGSFGGIGADPRLYGKGVGDDEAGAIMDRAFDLGINCFDTANSYGGGASERAIGKWLKQKGPGVRDQLLISTKVHHPVGTGPNDSGLSRRHIMQQIDASLRRLNVDYVDMYLPHATDASTPLEETLGALDDLVRIGKVRYIGASGFPAWMIAKALWVSDKYGYERFEWVQDSYSLLDRGLDAEMIPLCMDQGLAITAYSPLAGGVLAGKYERGAPAPEGSRVALSPTIYGRLLSDDTFENLETLAALAAEKGVDSATLAVAWLLSLPCPIFPIIGPRRPGHLDVVPAALSVELTPGEVAQLSGLFASSTGIPRRWARPGIDGDAGGTTSARAVSSRIHVPAGVAPGSGRIDARRGG